MGKLTWIAGTLTSLVGTLTHTLRIVPGGVGMPASPAVRSAHAVLTLPRAAGRLASGRGKRAAPVRKLAPGVRKLPGVVRRSTEVPCRSILMIGRLDPIGRPAPGRRMVRSGEVI